MISLSTLVIAIAASVVIGAILIFRTMQDLRLVHKAAKRGLTRPAEES